MAGRNQVTANLKISAEAQLKNSRNFISELERITDKFDFGNKINTQINNAKAQLKEYNKVLERIKNKSLISENEIKELTKASKGIADLAEKTERLYSGFNDSQLKKFSREYLRQIEEQQKEIAKIKEKYFQQTGNNFDKDFSNLEKYKQKVQSLEKEIKDLNNSKDNRIKNRIDEENKVLQTQFENLQRINRIEKERENKRQNIIDNYNQNTNLKIDNSKGKIKSEKEDVAKEMANSNYKNLLNTYTQISKKREEILNSGKTDKQIQKELISLAKQYNLQNVKNTEQFEKQFKVLQEQKKFYNLLKNRNQLVDEQELTKEYEKRLQLVKDLAEADKQILGQNKFPSEKDFTNQKRKVENTLNSTRVNLSTEGASLTTQAEEDIGTDITSATTEQTNKLIQELNNTKSLIEQITQYMAKLATQSERGVTPNDIKNESNRIKNEVNNHTDRDGADTRQELDSSEENIIQQIIIDKAAATGREIKQSLDSLPDMDNYLDSILPSNGEQLNLKQLEISNLVDNYFDKIASLEKTSRYLQDPTLAGDTEQYKIVNDEAISSIDEARKLSIKIIGEIKNTLWQEMAELKQKEDSLFKHDASGKVRYDENNNPVYKKGHDRTEYEQIEAEYDEKMASFLNADAAQGNIDVALADRQQALEGTKRILEGYTEEIQETNDAEINYGKILRNNNNAVQKAAEQTQFLGSTFADLKNKVGYFLSMNYIFDTAVRKIREASTFVKELDKDMVQIGLVLGQTASQTWKNFDTYSNMADRLNTTVSDVTASMKLFYQQGLNTVEVNKMIEASAIAAALGESSMAEASETLTSIINSYNLSASQAIDVTDKISMVAMVSAADFGELSTAIEKVASSAASAGLDLDHMMGYLAKMVETTREAPTNIGTALKTIVANFSQFKEDPNATNEDGIDINKADKALKTVGIQLLDTNGEMRDLGEIIDELGKKWSGLSRNTKSYLATVIAGTRQQSRFYALMNDYDRTLELVNESTQSEGKATQQFALYQRSLTASTQRLNNEWEKFYNSIFKNDGLLKGFTDTLTKLLKVMNKIGPELSVIFSVGIVKGLRDGMNFISYFKSNLKELHEQLLDTSNIIQSVRAENNVIPEMNFYSSKENAPKGLTKGNQLGNFVAQSMFKKNGGEEQTEVLQKLLDISTALEQKNIDLLKSNQDLLESFLSTEQVTEVLNGNINESIQNAATQAVNNQAGIVQHTALTAVKWGEVAAQAALNLAVMAGVAVIGLLISETIKAANAEHERTIRAQELAKETQTEYEEAEELVKKYKELSSQINLTEDEKEQLKEVTNSLIEQYPELIQAIDGEGNAYASTNARLEEFLKNKEKLAASADTNQAQNVLNDKKIKDTVFDDKSFIAGASLVEDENFIGEYTKNASKRVTSVLDSINNLKDTKLLSNGGVELKYKLQEALATGEKEPLEKLLEDAKRQIENRLALNSFDPDQAEQFTNLANSLLNEFDGMIEANITDYTQKATERFRQMKFDKNLTTEQGRIADSVLNQFYKNQFADKKTGQQMKEAINSPDFISNVDNLLNSVKKLTSDEIEEYNNFLTETTSGKKSYNEIKEKADKLNNVFDATTENYLKDLEKTLSTVSDILGISSETLKKYSGERLQKIQSSYGNLTDEDREIFKSGLNKVQNNESFWKDYENLDATDMSSITEFKEKYSNILGNYGKKFFEVMLKTPQYDAEKTAETLNNSMSTLQGTGDTQSGDSMSDVISGNSQEGAFNILSSDDESRAQNLLFLGNQLLVSAEEISTSYEKAFKDVSNYTAQIKEQAQDKIDNHIKNIRDALDNQDWNLGDKIDYNKLDEGQKKVVDNNKKVIKNLQNQINIAEELRKKYSQLSVEQQANVDYAPFRNGAIAVQQMISNLSNLAEIYDVVTNKEYTQLDLINWIANDTSGQLLAALEVENGQLMLNANSMEALAEAHKQEAISTINNQINKLEGQLIYLNGVNECTESELQSITSINDAQNKLTQNLGTNIETSSSNLLTWVSNWAKAGGALGKTINFLINKFNNLFKAEKEGNGSTGDNGGPGTADIDTSADKNDELIDIESRKKTIQDNKDKLKALRDGLKKTSGVDLLKGINDRGSYGGNKDNGGKDDDMLEKLDHFYNYLRKIEKLEAKINRLREERNLIDTSKNYYIDNLIEENKLLAEQQKLYSNYIRDEGEYLTELRGELTKKFSKWVTFDDEGVVQVKQTEFNINSEKQQEEYKNFSELLGLYQEEYNTREENITKLTQAQIQQVENIAAAYEKVLARVTDVNDAIQKSIDLLEHDVTMSFSNIAKFDIFDEQAEKAVKGIREMFGFVNEYQAQIDKINKQISEGALKEFFRWDEDLGYYRSNDLLLEDKDMQKKYEKMGYSWSEIHTYVKQTAKASEQLKQSWEESTDKANSFAETLKSLLENSISTFTNLVSSSGDELNKIFDTFDRKMNNIDNESNLFGVASENLEDKYVTLVTATATLKQTIGLLNDKRVAILDTIKEQYSEFVDEINGYTVINKQAIEESDKLTDGQKAQLLSWYEAFNAYDELVEASEDRLVDYFNQILEMENEKRDAIINLKQSVHDELIARDQEEIDDLREKYDKMSQLDNEYYNKLADKVNRARQLREDRQADSAIPQTQAQIAVLKTDNSGTRNSEILNLQKQLNEQLQSQADRDVDRELERIQREQQEREEDRQLTIAAMENVLTFKDENNWYWQEAQRIWAEGPESVTGFLRTSNEYMNISDEQRAQLFEELSNSVNTAFATLQTAAGITSAISDGIVKDKSDEEQAKLDNVNNNLGFIQSQLGQEGLAGKIDWANAENAKHLLEIQTNAEGNTLKITAKLEDLYKEKIGPTAENLQNTVVQYLGKESDIWRKLGMLDATTGQVNTSVESGFTQLTDAVNKAITWISSDMDKAWSEYKTKAIEVFNYLSKEYGKQNAQTPDKNDVKLPDVKKEPTKNEPPKPTTPVKTDNSSGGTSKKTLKVGGGATAKTGAKIYSSYAGGSGAGQYYSKDPNYKVLQLRGNRALVRWHKLSSGYTGWFNKTDLTPYRKGGYVNYTGIAAVHGSKTSPEAFLSAKQTKLFEVLRDSLVATTNKGYTKEEKEATNTGYNIDNINIEVKELADVDSVEKMTRKVKEEIYKDATGRNNMAVRRR